MDNTQEVLHDMGVRKINFKDKPNEVFELKLLPANKARRAFLKATSLLAPLITHSLDTFSVHKSRMDEVERDEEAGIIPEVPTLTFFEMSLTLSEQLNRPEAEELWGLLLDGLTKNGQEVDFDKDYLSVDKQLKLVEYSFQENLSTPFMNWLEEKGYTSILTSLQSAVSEVRGETN